LYNLIKSSVFSILVFIAFFFFVTCFNYKEIDSSRKNVPRIKQKVHIGNFKTDFKIFNNLKWTLKGTDAYYYNDKKIKLSNLLIKYYNDKDQKESYIISDFGSYNSKTKSVILISNVILYSTNGRQLRADYLKWDNNTEKLVSQPGYLVTLIDKQDGKVAGYGFTADKKLQNVTFASNVSGSVEEDKIDELEDR